MRFYGYKLSIIRHAPSSRHFFLPPCGGGWGGGLSGVGGNPSISGAKQAIHCFACRSNSSLHGYLKFYFGETLLQTWGCSHAAPSVLGPRRAILTLLRQLWSGGGIQLTFSNIQHPPLPSLFPLPMRGSKGWGMFRSASRSPGGVGLARSILERRCLHTSWS